MTISCGLCVFCAVVVLTGFVMCGRVYVCVIVKCVCVCVYVLVLLCVGVCMC